MTLFSVLSLTSDLGHLPIVSDLEGFAKALESTVGLTGALTEESKLYDGVEGRAILTFKVGEHEVLSPARLFFLPVAIFQADSPAGQATMLL